MASAGSNERSTPNLTDSLVMGDPSSNFRPSLSVKVHTVASALGVPVSVARSGAIVAPSSPDAVVSVR